MSAAHRRTMATATVLAIALATPIAQGPTHATDPGHPTSQELDAIRKRIDAYQQIFQTH